MKNLTTAILAMLLISGIATAQEKDIFGLVGDGFGPSLTEDGTRIVYFDRDYQIWSVNTDGTARTRLTWGHFDLNPVWSPDGTRIAFRRSAIMNDSSYSDIWVMNADGSGQARMTDAVGTKGYYDRPSWSPDGTKIAMEAAVAGMMSEIYIMDVATKKMMNLTAANTPENNRFNHEIPVWLADGERISFTRNNEFTVRAAFVTSKLLAGK